VSFVVYGFPLPVWLKRRVRTFFHEGMKAGMHCLWVVAQGNGSSHHSAD
jgi:hypothetical protein